MEMSPEGINLIKRFESCNLTCYLDLRGLPTIGWGHRTSLPVGTNISQDEADQLLSDDLKYVIARLRQLISIQLTDTEFSALVCLAYNIGVTSFKDSTLLKLVNGGGIQPAADEFLKWDHASGLVIPGLLRRRQAERSLFLT